MDRRLKLQIFFQLVRIQSIGELLVEKCEKQLKSFLFINLAVERDEWSVESQLYVVKTKLNQHEKKWNRNPNMHVFICDISTPFL